MSCRGPEGFVQSYMEYLLLMTEVQSLLFSLALFFLFIHTTLILRQQNIFRQIVIKFPFLFIIYIV